MKTYILTISRFFPKKHCREGEPTDFIAKIKNTQGIADNDILEYKLHTIRTNYQLWEKRINEVQAGKAIISLRYWAANPYHKDENGIGQVEFLKLDKTNGIGIQKIEFKRGDGAYVDGNIINFPLLVRNDGLSFTDFQSWFASYDLSKPMAIIHFTKFRY